jgi:hypothetical protein
MNFAFVALGVLMAAGVPMIGTRRQPAWTVSTPDERLPRRTRRVRLRARSSTRNLRQLGNPGHTY